MSSGNVFGGTFSILHVQYHVITSSDSFTSFFPVWIRFVSFYFLIAVARTSNTVLNKSGRSRHPCLVSCFKGNSLSFSSLRVMFAVGLSYIKFLFFLFS